jgi:hypothetical protein
MKKLLVFLILMQVFLIAAQNKQLIYGFSEIPQSLMQNPGEKVLTKTHIGIPFLSQFHINGGASGVRVYDIFGTQSSDINSRIGNTINALKNTDFFTVTQQLELFNFGWKHNEDIYFSAGMYQEFDFITYFPKDLALLAWYGNRDYLDKTFNLGEVSTRADLLTVFHFGVNKKITKKLTAGLRVKLYSSMASFNSTQNSGSFVTTLGDGTTNIYEHRLRNVDMKVQTSGLASLYDLENPSDIAKKMLGRAFLGGNLGLGLDAGFTYDITNRLTATGSILDFGAIFHTKDVETYTATGNYTLHGIQLIFPPLTEGTPPYYDNLETEIENQVPIDTISKSYTNLRPLKVNGALTYKFGRAVLGEDDCDCRSRGSSVARNQSVGVQVFSIFRPQAPQLAGTFFYYRKFGKYLATKATYTIDAYSFSNVGLALVADLGPINFYIAGDNILKYNNLAKAKSVSLQLGLNIKIYEQ